ncbi:hypothetical protein HWV62_20316 [Athelia sp. TMB]|nr:hypothetical protein HWV62_20316 [Athelia sp. TMB]
MDRSTEPPNAPDHPTQPSGPEPAEDSRQELLQPPAQASSSRPIHQSVPRFAQNAPQTASNTTGVGPRAPPIPAKSEADRAFRASRPMSRPVSSSSQDHYVDAPDAPVELLRGPPTPARSEADRAFRASSSRSSPISQERQADAPYAPTGLENPPREQPPRRGSTLRAPSVIVSNRGYNENGTYRLAEPPLVTPPPTRRYGSAIDWVIRGSDKHTPYVPGPKTVGQRLDPTLEHARSEMAASERKGATFFRSLAQATSFDERPPAMLNGYTLNTAIGMQVVLGALVTGLSSALPSGKAGITTAILGGISTIVASYLARMRGSREPELSLTRAKDLDNFIRDAEAFQLDFGEITDGSKNAELEEYRRRFEELLGNVA